MEKFKNIFWKKLKFCIQIPMTTSFKSDTAVIELKIFYILTVTLLYYFYCHYYCKYYYSVITITITINITITITNIIITIIIIIINISLLIFGQTGVLWVGCKLKEEVSTRTSVLSL